MFHFIFGIVMYKLGVGSKHHTVRNRMPVSLGGGGGELGNLKP
jgi:hypothetical protein